MEERNAHGEFAFKIYEKLSRFGKIHANKFIGTKVKLICSLNTLKTLNYRISLLLIRYNIDAVEKQVLQTALDNLQNNIQIKNRSHLVDRLESITRRSLLKFTDNANTNSLFISSDMFYLEILLDPQSGKVNDVKVSCCCRRCANKSAN